MCAVPVSMVRCAWIWMCLERRNLTSWSRWLNKTSRQLSRDARISSGLYVDGSSSHFRTSRVMSSIPTQKNRSELIPTPADAECGREPTVVDCLVRLQVQLVVREVLHALPQYREDVALLDRMVHSQACRRTVR